MQKSPAEITPEQAKLLLRGDLANLVNRVRAGQPLTRAQRSLLLSASSNDGANGVLDAASDLTTAGNYEELARALKVTARSLRTWRKLPGAPSTAANGSHDVGAWRAFLLERGLKGGEGDEDGSEDGESIDHLKRRRMWIDIQEREFRHAVAKREFVSIELVREKWGNFVAQGVTLLRKKLEDESPPVLVGLDALEIREELGSVIEEFIKLMHGGGDV